MKNSALVLYAAAATVWLALGIATWNIIYLLLAAVFYVFAIVKWFKRKQ